MRGKIARELRKECVFNPNDFRDYQEIEVETKKQIYQFGSDKDGKTEINLVWRVVPAFITECTSGGRKIYKYLKRKWNNLDHEATFNKLPSIADLENIAKEIMSDEELKTEMKKLRGK